MDSLPENLDIATAATPSRYTDRPTFLNNLAEQFGTRFEDTNSLACLDRAIEAAEIAVDITSPEDRDERATRLHTLGYWLGTRFENKRLPADLDRAVEATQLAVDNTGENHHERLKRLNNLTIWYGMRFESLGCTEDLDKSVDVGNLMMKATKPDDPRRVGRLNNLGNALGRRYERTHSMEDLKWAIDIAERAFDATGMDDPNRAKCLNNLGIWLVRRFERTNIIEDLNRAVDCAVMAVEAIHQEWTSKGGRLNNLGTWLSRRFDVTKKMDDLNRAVEAAQLAVKETPTGHPKRADRLNNSANRRYRQYEETKGIEHLNEAINLSKMAVEATGIDEARRAGRLKNLGNRLRVRYERLRFTDDIQIMDDLQSKSDLQGALEAYKEGWQCGTSPPAVRIDLARQAATILASQGDETEAEEILQDAIKMLPLVSLRMLENSDKQYTLREFSGLASMAAAISLNAHNDHHRALQILELGRCVLAGLLLDMRTDMSDLRKKHPGLALEFETLRDELDSPSESGVLTDEVPWESRTSSKSKAEQRLNDVLVEIRSRPGFENALLPPTSGEVMAAAEHGPLIIVNVSPYRCDALIVEKYRIRLEPLPELSEKELNAKFDQKSVGSVSTLEWLWKVAAGPIMAALGYHTCNSAASDGIPHVWWIPTGVLSHFPIHAAGIHAKGSKNSVLDRVMSSYASSIKALVYGRQNKLRKAAGTSKGQALLVAMQDTLNHRRLPFANEEVDMVASLCPSLNLEPVIPTRSRENVLAQLQTCKIFHFAGHGRSDALDPARSSLLLDDWKETLLTVGDVRDRRILQDTSPFLGYLSACSTGSNKVKVLVDEGIHLVSAFQLAGFRHVIGTLWEVADLDCVNVAKVVYETLRVEDMTDVAVCRGLHLATKALRDSCIDEIKDVRDGEDLEINGQIVQQKPLNWIPYVHFGV
jgi:tetratricopeptide (TPR) repeat protein